VAYHFW